jgi:hypothetical protein
MMKSVETPEHPAVQVPEQRFQASYREAWGIWMRLLQEEHLLAAFTRRDDAEAYANKHPSGGQRAEIRGLWVLINETLGEAYALGDRTGPALHAVDLDFNRRSKLNVLRQAALDKLTDEELQALGLSRG